jgi:carbonic anhydrase
VTTTDDLLGAAGRYAKSWPPGGSAPAARPARGVALVVCMDARIDVYSLFGLAPGEAHVIRNAGGLVTDDVLRSLAISQRLDDEAFATSLEQEVGSRPPWVAGGFSDVREDVRRSLEAVRSCPWLVESGAARGFVFDVESGQLDEVR